MTKSPTRLMALLMFGAVCLAACAHQTPRQQFYMAEVAFVGAQSAAIAYLKTPYGQQANIGVLTAIEEASDEGTKILKRTRPLVPNPGQEVSDLQLKLILSGLNTLESIVERLNRTVFAPSQYEE